MNLLAHAFLANGDPDRIVGQLCGDFVRGSDLSGFAPAVQLGIRCHRAVDTYTDKHPANIAARNLFERPYRRFAGIAVDVVYDYFLANDWQEYCDIPLQDYAGLVTKSLQKKNGELPLALRRFTALLETENTLYRNLERSHIELTLQRIAGRRKSMAPLASIAPLVWEREALLKRSFDGFFPQLLSYTHTYHKELTQDERGGHGRE